MRRGLRAPPPRGRRSIWSTGLATSVAIAAVLLSASASAAPTEQPVRVDYAAPASCPNRDALLEHVRARTASVRLADEGENALDVVVRVDLVRGQYRGRLALPSGGALHEREIVDAKCDALIEALGFFIALSIDAHRSTQKESPPAAEPAAIEPPAPEEPARPALVQLPPPPAPIEAHSPGAAERRLPTPVPREPRWRIGGGAGGAVIGGVSPSAQIASRFALELVREQASSAVAMTPSFSVAAMSTATTTDGDSRGALALRWQALAATACPLAITLSGVAAVRPCSFVEVGRLRGEGVGIDEARRNDAVWVAVGISGRLDVAILPSLFLEVDVGGSAPLMRPRFSYTSGTVAFDTPASGGRMGLTLAFIP